MTDVQAGLAEDLRAHIFITNANESPAERRCSRWVMNAEWFREVLELDDRTGILWHPSLTAAEPGALLGLPIEVREDGGVPHLEPV